jgi:hypothetical protein
MGILDLDLFKTTNPQILEITITINYLSAMRSFYTRTAIVAVVASLTTSTITVVVDAFSIDGVKKAGGGVSTKAP